MTNTGKCPFCSSDSSQVDQSNTLGSSAYVWCHECEAHGPKAPDKETAVKLWNTRWVKVEL